MVVLLNYGGFLCSIMCLQKREREEREEERDKD
jgi:hypothetical protein